MATTSAVIDDDARPDDAQQLATRWITDLDISEKWQRAYIDRCGRIIRRYKNELASKTASDVGLTARRFAILWSNTQTLGPAIYARQPEAVVGRRYKDPDPVGRYASEVLERSINYSNDAYDFQDRMELSRDDYLLFARAQTWVRYTPFEAEDASEDGEQVDTEPTDKDEPAYAEVCWDHLNYADWGMEPCREWSEAGYVWRRVFMTKTQLKERFPDLAEDIPLDWKPPQVSGEKPKERAKRAAIYEIWDKPSGTIYWVSKAYGKSVLDQRKDWLKLKDFFPCPRPLMGTITPDTFIPVPDYVFYQDQAEEIDELTGRIATLINALRMVGIYAGEERDMLANVFNGTNNTLIPVPSMASLTDKGGLKGLIEWLPIDMVIQTLEGCFDARAKILEDIWQITGIADVMRGQVDPDEKLGQSQLKTQWGSLRVRDRQMEMQRFARDMMRISGEIIAKKFPQQTLASMTDVKLLTNQQKEQVKAVGNLTQQLQQQVQTAQPQPPQPGMPPQAPQVDPRMLQMMQQRIQQIQAQLPPDAQNLMNEPSWEDVMDLLHNSEIRQFRIDIETDSTVQPDENMQKQAATEFVEAIGQLIAQSLPLLQAVPQSAPLIAESVKYLTRHYRAGREMEEVIDKVFDQLAQMPPQQPEGKAAPSGPTPQELAIQQAAVEQKAQQAQQDAQTHLAVEQGKLQLGQAELSVEAAKNQQTADATRVEQMIKLEALKRDPKPQVNA